MKEFEASSVFAAALVTGLFLGLAPEIRASVSYSTPGATYSQDFDSLPASPTGPLGDSPLGWIDDTTTPGTGQYSLLGWYLYHPLAAAEGGANGHQRFRIIYAPGNVGSFYSFGSSGSSDRALGSIGANTLAVDGGAMYIGLRLHNDTGLTLDSFTLGYTGEQWRNGGNTEGLIFMWSVTASAISDPDSAFTRETALDFAAPVNGGTAVSLNGNLAANRVVISPVTISGINWLPDTDLWLRWNDIQIPSTDHGLGIDDLAFSAAQVPEPSSLALLGLGVASLGALRRARRA